MQKMRSRLVSRFILSSAGLVLILAGTGCEDQKMTAEIADIRIKIDAVRQSTKNSENETVRLKKEETSLRNDPLFRQGKEQLAKKLDESRSEVETMQKRKRDLEASLTQAKSELDAYRKKYP